MVSDPRFRSFRHPSAPFFPAHFLSFDAMRSWALLKYQISAWQRAQGVEKAGKLQNGRENAVFRDFAAIFPRVPLAFAFSF